MRTPEVPRAKERRLDLPRAVGFQNSGLLSNREVVGLLETSLQLLAGKPPLSRIVFRPPSEIERKLNWKGRVSWNMKVIFVFPLPDADALEHMREEIWDGMIKHRLLWGPGLGGETEESFDLDFEEARKELSQGLARIDLKWTIFHELAERWLHLNFSQKEKEDLENKMSSLSSHEDIFFRGFFGFEKPREGRDTPKEEFCESVAAFFGTPRLLKFVNLRRYEILKEILVECGVIEKV